MSKRHLFDKVLSGSKPPVIGRDAKYRVPRPSAAPKESMPVAEDRVVPDSFIDERDLAESSESETEPRTEWREAWIEKVERNIALARVMANAVDHIRQGYFDPKLWTPPDAISKHPKAFEIFNDIKMHMRQRHAENTAVMDFFNTQAGPSISDKNSRISSGFINWLRKIDPNNRFFLTLQPIDVHLTLQIGYIEVCVPYAGYVDQLRGALQKRESVTEKRDTTKFNVLQLRSDGGSAVASTSLSMHHIALAHVSRHGSVDSRVKATERYDQLAEALSLPQSSQDDGSWNVQDRFLAGVLYAIQTGSEFKLDERFCRDAGSEHGKEMVEICMERAEVINRFINDYIKTGIIDPQALAYEIALLPHNQSIDEIMHYLYIRPEAHLSSVSTDQRRIDARSYLRHLMAGQLCATHDKLFSLDPHQEISDDEELLHNEVQRWEISDGHATNTSKSKKLFRVLRDRFVARHNDHLELENEIFEAHNPDELRFSTPQERQIVAGTLLLDGLIDKKPLPDVVESVDMPRSSFILKPGHIVWIIRDESDFRAVLSKLPPTKKINNSTVYIDQLWLPIFNSYEGACFESVFVVREEPDEETARRMLNRAGRSIFENVISYNESSPEPYDVFSQEILRTLFVGRIEPDNIMHNISRRLNQQDFSRLEECMKRVLSDIVDSLRELEMVIGLENIDFRRLAYGCALLSSPDEILNYIQRYVTFFKMEA